MSEIKLGSRVRDKHTGFTGIAIAKTKWIHGCTRFTVKPETLKDGATIDAEGFDEPQLELVDPEVVGTTSKTGGPQDEPQRPTSL